MVATEHRTWMALRPDTRSTPIYLTIRCPHGCVTTRLLMPETWVLAPDIVTGDVWRRFAEQCRECRRGTQPELTELFQRAIDHPEVAAYRIAQAQPPAPPQE